MRRLFTSTESIRFSAFWCKVLIFCAVALVSFTNTGLSQTVFTEDWESGIGSWFADNGVWEVGTPTVGPSITHSGVNCAGTVLDGNYPNSANSRLTSPQITLPGLAAGEKHKLKFWSWFRMDTNPNDYDHGFVQISTDGGNNWETISGNYDNYSTAWTQSYIDISTYANSTVRIGFMFISSDSETDNGWYIDDVSISKGPDIFHNPEDFEIGSGDWSADNGLWEIGTPTVGPTSTHSGENCAGTILNGNYNNSANTRLVSPEVTLTSQSGQSPELFFWEWHRMDNNPNDYDYGVVQISVNGGSWQTISDPYDEYSEVWAQSFVSLSAYADSTVRIAFYFISSDSEVDNGWYIDDIRIEGIITEIEENQNEIPNEYNLSQNYPNPFNPSTTIKYQIQDISFVTIKVYDVLGNEIATLVNEEKPAGSYEVEFDATQLSSGIYFYRLQANEFTQIKKMILLK